MTWENNQCPVCGWESKELPIEESMEHCPHCLCSRHETDDDGYECGGLNEPVSIWVMPTGKWAVIQRCRLCGEMHSSDLLPTDNPVKVMSLAAKPISSPPFPIEKMEELTVSMGGSGDIGGYYHES